jgi:hypothetical protein
MLRGTELLDPNKYIINEQGIPSQIVHCQSGERDKCVWLVVDVLPIVNINTDTTPVGFGGNCVHTSRDTLHYAINTAQMWLPIRVLDSCCNG